MPSINPQAVRGPVTAIPVVAGKGVRLVADTENNRVVAEADETVLWEGSLYQVGDSYIENLTESVRNFQKIQIWVRRRFQAVSAGRPYLISDVSLTFESSNNALTYVNAFDIASGTYTQNCIYIQFPTDTTLKLLAGTKFNGGTYSNNITSYDFVVQKVIGVNRISASA